MADHVVSTGRGGAGNIGADPTVYTDGGIVREGTAGVSPEGNYSTGRGGTGNIGSPRIGPQELDPPSSDGSHRGLHRRRLSQDVIPETSLRTEPYENFHTGRGGEGNVYRERYGGHSKDPERERVGLGERVKRLFGAGGGSRSRSRTRSRSVGRDAGTRAEVRPGSAAGERGKE